MLATHRLRCPRRGARAPFLPGSEGSNGIVGSPRLRNLRRNDSGLKGASARLCRRLPPREEGRRRTVKYLCFGYYDKDRFDGMTEDVWQHCRDTSSGGHQRNREGERAAAPLGVGLNPIAVNASECQQIPTPLSFGMLLAHVRSTVDPLSAICKEQKHETGPDKRCTPQPF